MSFEVKSLEYDSKQVQPGSLFFAVRGAVHDGHRFIPQVLEKGAGAVISELPPPDSFPVPWVQTAEIRPYMAMLANEFHSHPSRDLNLVGITGTNGKTTTAYLLHAILEQDAPSLMLGTVTAILAGQEAPSVRTTPEAIDIQRFLAQGRDLGCRHGVLEVSSHALELQRVYECSFQVAIFTNLSQDHLDFHPSMEDYFQAKCRLFHRSHNPGLKLAVLNGDDAVVARLRPSSGIRVTTFGLSPDCQVRPITQQLSVDGIETELDLDGERVSLSSPLVGTHNLYNLMAAVVAAREVGIPIEKIQRGVSQCANVPGRFERVSLDAPFSVFVDYAHTPEALANILGLARQVAAGRVICLFGCGGDRDRGKRPLMGEVALRLADHVVVTSDNPRSEDPAAIISEIVQGMRQDEDRWCSVNDRREAISRALSLAVPGDLVLLAGKGHEPYQEIDGGQINFDDRQVAREEL